jgi:cell division protein FtsQ
MVRATVAKPLPADIRLMNRVASAVFVLAALTLLAAALAWLTRLPWFTLRTIQIDGELTRSSVATLRANATPRLRGNFFSFDLARGRAAFEAVPWVRHAMVRRVWPDKLAVTLEEHRAVALWQGEHGNDQLVNSHGEIFEANVGDVEDEGLPRFSGPRQSAAAMLAMYRALDPVLAGVDGRIAGLQLSGRGSWRVELDSGAAIELGRAGPSGDMSEVVARAQRFARTLYQVASRFEHRPLEYADLRHADGYALRLKGITTTPAASAPAARK